MTRLFFVEVKRSAQSFVVAVGVVLALLAYGGTAKAQGRDLLTPLGGKGQLAIDQVSGFRVGPFIPGGGPSVTYYGPIGLAVQRYSEAGPNVQGNDVFNTTTIWFAPSLDVFVINHLSIGGMIEIAYTSGSSSVPDPRNPSVTTSSSIPSQTDFTILPRVGYLFAIGQRFGIWPRGAIGYASRQYTDTTTMPSGRETFRGLILDFDVGAIFRVNETFFLRLAPEVAFLPAGAHATTADNVTVSQSANLFQFTLTGGIGVFLPL
jgi:hypothetical protein